MGTSNSALFWSRQSEQHSSRYIPGCYEHSAQNDMRVGFLKSRSGYITGCRRGKRPMLAALEQVQAHRLGKGFLTAMDVQFAVETTDLGLDRVRRNHQFV